MTRWRLLGILWLCVAHLASAAPALVQSEQVTVTAADSQNLAYGAAVSTNQLLFAYCAVSQGVYSTADAAFSDTLGNTWTVIINVGPGDGGAGNEPVRVWGAYTVSTGSGGNTVTCDPPGTSNFITLVILSMSGVQTTTPLDQVTKDNDENGTTTPNTGTTASTTVADAIMVAGLATGADYTVTSITESAPCVLAEEVQSAATFQTIAVCTYVVTATGTQTASWTLNVSQTWAAGIAAFKGAAVAASVRRGSPIVFQ